MTPGNSDRCESSEDNGKARQAPPIDAEVLFRSLIEDELCHGRLSPSRSRRIVRYAAAMGLKATEAGALISECRNEALKNADPMIRQHALRLVYPDPPLIPAGVKLALVVAVAIALDLLLVAVLMK